MRKSKMAVTGTVALALGLLASTVGAATTVSITSPASGASISRSTSPKIDVTGAVGFDVPQPSERAFYVRRTSCNTDQRLSTQRGGETASCAETMSLTPVAEENAVGTTYDAENGVPLTLDASRPITGVVSVVSYAGQSGAGTGAGMTTIDITLTGGNQTLGSTTVSYTATPAQYQYNTAWTIQPAATLDKKDLSSLQLLIKVRGRNVMHGFVRPNTTTFTVPIYTESFTRKVELAVDNGAFSATGVTLSPDLTSFAGSVTTPAVGSHTIKARAVQGAEISGLSSVPITVTA
jgi:hypothetical protein